MRERERVGKRQRETYKEERVKEKIESEAEISSILMTLSHYKFGE